MLIHFDLLDLEVHHLHDHGSGGLQESVVNSGIPQAQSSWGAMDSAKETVAVATEVLPGVNGTSCSLYPACVDVGIKDSVASEFWEFFWGGW